MYNEGITISASYPSPPSSNPLSYLSFTASAISWLFNTFMGLLTYIASAMTFSIYPYPLNTILSIVFSILLFYGAYPFIAKLVHVIIDLIKALPFT